MSKCWHCATETASGPHCLNCHKLQPLQHISAFTLLDLEPTYALDEQLLETAYLAKQRRLHPDSYIGATQQEKVHAAQWSAALNDAYQALKHPLKRAEILLQKDVLNNFASHHHQDLLNEMLVWHEKVDQAATAASLEEMQKSMDTKHQHLIEILTTLFTEKATEQDIAPFLFRLRYILKLEDAIAQKIKKIKRSHALTNS